MTRWRLRSDVRIAVEYGDRTPFGSPLTDRPEQGTQELYAPLLEHVRRHGFDDFVQAAPALLAEVVESAAFARIAEPDGAGAWRIRPEVLYPDPALARPRAILLERDDSGGRVRANLPPDYWPPVHALIAVLSGAGQDDGDPSLHPDVRALLGGVVKQELVEAPPGAGPDPSLVESDLTFLGHNTVVVRSGTSSVIVDPFLFAGGRECPAEYQPLQLRDLGPIDAVLVTHSHPDHFDPASLLRFPPETQVVVPRVERETLLATAMEARLGELGFSRISVLDWGQSIQVGDIEVHALPFYGEQPTDSQMLHPEVRNAGNTYLVRTPRFSAVFLADSGRDGQGDVKEVAGAARARLGAVDIVFSGYRGWLLYPAQYLFSSVSRFVLFVPPWLWSTRQQIMTDAHSAFDVAERWGARYVAAYADGGAPWYWNVGLGPRLDDAASELALFDPFPERLAEAGRSRAEAPGGRVLGSTVRPLIPRPGDSLRGLPDGAETVRVPGHAWPYAERLELSTR